MKLLLFDDFFLGPRDHPDIAESFMLLHAQVDRLASTAMPCRFHPIQTNNNIQLYLSVHIFRLLNGSLTCTCLTSWMSNLCFTAVGALCALLQFLGTCNNLFKVKTLFFPFRYFIPEVSRDAHSKSGEFLLCGFELKFQRFQISFSVVV